MKVKTGLWPASLTDKRTLDADLVIFATGFAPNSAGPRRRADLEERTGAILVNEYMQTSDPDIYAGGDCVAFEPHHRQSPFMALGPRHRQGRVIGTNAASDNGKAAASTRAVGMVRENLQDVRVRLTYV